MMDIKERILLTNTIFLKKCYLIGTPPVSHPTAQ